MESEDPEQNIRVTIDDGDGNEASQIRPRGKDELAAAIADRDAAFAERDAARRLVHETEVGAVEMRRDAAQTRVEAAKQAYRDAFERGEIDKMADAQES